MKLRKTLFLAIAAAMFLSCNGEGEKNEISEGQGEVEWCDEHGIAEAECAWCDPSLIESEGYCEGHGVAEALCWKCKPAVIAGYKAEKDWCEEHELPESRCKICNPDDPSGRTEDGAANPVHPRDANLRASRRNSDTCETSSLVVKFANAEIAKRAGLEYFAVTTRSITEDLSANCEIVFDGNRYAHISSRVKGVVSRVLSDVGAKVTKGETLLVIDSSELSEAKSDLIAANARLVLSERNLGRFHSLLAGGATSELSLLEAETNLVEAKLAENRAQRALGNLGLTDEEIESVVLTSDTSPLLNVKAPFDGEIAARHAVLGEFTDDFDVLFDLCDMSRMWAMIDIHQDSAGSVRLGAPVTIKVPGPRNETASGEIAWIGSSIDPRTRTLKVRAELDNTRGALRDGMFTRASVRVYDSVPSIVVPKSAVHWEGCCNVVFERRSETEFAPRKVTIDYANEGYYVLREGLEEGAQIVTTGSFLLKTELMKESIGAGCCEVEESSK
ncbi:MAG: efflux RND transporter periplasmic adaptor subunit [Planctomycetes bacterium]|nr:efflux RND transporter periplasmic adaptor subunit [Planctomycetota bacterium]